MNWEIKKDKIKEFTLKLVLYVKLQEATKERSGEILVQAKERELSMFEKKADGWTVKMTLEMPARSKGGEGDWTRPCRML